MLEDGLNGVPEGHTASVVTHLEMLEEAPQRPEAVSYTHLTLPTNREV